MTPSPASASHVFTTLAGLALVVAVLVLLGYAVLCALWPYAVCRRCHGASRLVTRRGRAHGLRLRWGRRAYNRLVRFRHARRADRLADRYGPMFWRDR